MNHQDHVFLLQKGIPRPGGVWADLGAGTGAFTLALAELLGPEGVVYAVDRDGRALRELISHNVGVTLHTLTADFTQPLSSCPRSMASIMAILSTFVQDKEPVVAGLIKGIKSQARWPPFVDRGIRHRSRQYLGSLPVCLPHLGEVGPAGRFPPHGKISQPPQPVFGGNLCSGELVGGMVRGACVETTRAWQGAERFSRPTPYSPLPGTKRRLRGRGTPPSRWTHICALLTPHLAPHALPGQSARSQRASGYPRRPLVATALYPLRTRDTRW